MSVGFVITHNGHWSPYYAAPESWGGFMTAALQEALLPLFTVGTTVVDPYDGAEYVGDELMLLANQLRAALNEIRTKEEPWPLRDAAEVARYFEAGKAYGVTLLPPTVQSVAIIERAIELADRAYARDQRLVFVGD